MLKSKHRISLLALTTALVLLAACGGPAAPAPTTTPPPPTAIPPTSTRTALPPTITATAGIPEGAYPEIPRVTLEEAKAAYDQKAATFVDVRRSADYDLGHVSGAINILYHTVDAHIGELDKAAWIIPYGVRPNEEESALVAFILLKNGFGKVTPLLGGYYAWRDSGLPTSH